MKKFIIPILTFISLLVFFRIIPHPPNFSPIIAGSIVSPFFFKSKILGSFLLIGAMFLTDIIFGFHTYQIVIYLTLMSIVFISPIVKTSYYKYFLISIVASLWFYLVTNFAVWLVWDFYSKDFQGIINCYILALPFFINTLFSTVFFTTLFIISYDYLKNIKLNFLTSN